MAKLNFTVPKHLPFHPIDVARSYVKAGIPVFPCREEEQEGIDTRTGKPTTWLEKSPYTSNGLNGASTSSRIADILFGQRHPDALIGVPTGKPLGAWVLDLDRHDPERDGHVWLAEMEELHGPLPETARASTANNGTHVFFRHVDGIRSNAGIAPGVDTRAQGGYICAPGSIMADGRAYRWIDWDQPGIPPIADAPQWLLDLVMPEIYEEPAPVRRDYVYEPSSNQSYVDSAIRGELERVAREGVGRRGHQLFASSCAVGEFVAAGAISRAEAERLLYEAAEACGVAQKDSERETRYRIRRGLDSTKNKPREIPDTAADNDNTRVDPEMARRVIESGKRKNAALAEEPAATPDTPAPKKRERFEKTWFDEIEEGAPKEMFIKGVFGVGEFTTVSGLPGTGKSVIVTDAACHVAAGMEWHGRKITQGLVVYVAAERKKLTERRMMAFRKRHNVKDVPLLVLGGRLDLTKDLKDARDLIAEIKAAETVTGMACVWVIIDTLSRVFGALDQNLGKDMQRFVQSCDEITAETHAHVTAIHHTAWSGERGKGAVDLDGAVDASFMVKKNGSRYQLLCDGTNDGEEGVILEFCMESVRIGVDADGEETTAPVVTPGEGVGTALVKTLTGKVNAVFDALEAACSAEGLLPPGDGGFPDGVVTVTEDQWRSAYYGGEATDALRKSFGRAKDNLIKTGRVASRGQFFWAA